MFDAHEQEKIINAILFSVKVIDKYIEKNAINTNYEINYSFYDDSANSTLSNCDSAEKIYIISRRVRNYKETRKYKKFINIIECFFDFIGDFGCYDSRLICKALRKYIYIISNALLWCIFEILLCEIKKIKDYRTADYVLEMLDALIRTYVPELLPMYYYAVCCNRELNKKDDMNIIKFLCKIIIYEALIKVFADVASEQQECLDSIAIDSKMSQVINLLEFVFYFNGSAEISANGRVLYYLGAIESITKNLACIYNIII